MKRENLVDTVLLALLVVCALAAIEITVRFTDALHWAFRCAFGI